MAPRTSLMLALGAACALLVAGCSSPSPADTSATSESAVQPTSESIPQDGSPCADPNTFCVGLVVESGTVDDGSLNEAAFEGVRDAAIATDAVVTYLESTDEDPYAANIEYLALSGYDVVVTTGVDVPQVTIDAAVAHPDTRFIGISQNMADGPANATGLLFADDEAGSFIEDLAGLIVEIHAGAAP